ncbi:MAG: hypothetical protein AABO57_22575 [Acidobacteriota bacterium]
MNSFPAKVSIIHRRWFLAGTALIILMAGACQSRVQSGPSIKSGGLGLSRTEWERLHGHTTNQDSGYSYYKDEPGQFIINFMGRGAAYIKRSYDDPAGVTLEEARKESQKLIPQDSRLIRTYNASAGPVDLYFSDALKPIFPTDDYWIHGEPGNFIVLYFSDHGIIDSFVIGLGNNP